MENNGIQIKTKTVTDVFDSNGKPLCLGDTILIRAGKEDIACRYEGVEKQYFCTSPYASNRGEIVKYRFDSIKKCTKAIIKFEEDVLNG